MRNIFFLFAIGFFIPACLHAEIVITEIMYDVEGTDTGREWIEVHNNGGESVDLSSWKLFEAGINHKLTAVGASIISAGGFAIIADVPNKFLADQAGFQGLLFDSAFSLSNEGETVVIRDQSGVDSDSVSYIPTWGALGDGFSLQESSAGSWIAAAETPGLATIATQSEAVISGGDANDISSKNESETQSSPSLSYSSQLIANTKPDDTDFVVTSGRSRLGFVGVPLVFQAKIKKADDSSVRIDHFWSMGDGSIRYGGQIFYAYRFPGDYTVVLNSISGKKEGAVSITKVKIIKPEAVISFASNEYIEISNKSDYELNIGGMILRTAGQRAMIPDDTIIAPHSSVRLPASSTRLNSLKGFVALDSPTGDNFSSVEIIDPIILLPEGFSLEDIRKSFIEALKKYEK